MFRKFAISDDEILQNFYKNDANDNKENEERKEHSSAASLSATLIQNLLNCGQD